MLVDAAMARCGSRTLDPANFGTGFKLPLAGWNEFAVRATLWKSSAPADRNGSMPVPSETRIARLIRIARVDLRAVIRCFLRDCDIMRVVLPHRRRADEDKLCVTSQAVDRLGS